MRVRENEILAATAVAMYIVFFAMYPPEWVRNVLANPLGMAALFGGSVYVALYKSKLVGGLLIVAFVLSMTRVTEHLTVGNVTIADGETYKCAESGEHGIIEAGKLRAFGSREIGKSYDSAAWSGNVKVIPCTGAASMRGPTIRTPKAAAGAGAGTTPPASGAGTGTTPPASGARQYQSYPNTVYRQGDISGGYVAGDVATCQARCDATPGCTGFARQIRANTCILKNSNLTTPSYDTDRIHYYTGTPPPGGPATPPGGSAGAAGPSTLPITTPTAPALSAPPPTPPATAPPAPIVPVRPVMSCNLENFAPF